MIFKLRETDVLRTLVTLFETTDITHRSQLVDLMIKINLKVNVEYSLDSSSDEMKKRILLWNDANTDYKIRIDSWKI